MKTAFVMLAGLLVGVLVAAGVLAALVFAGPDPAGLRPTPAPTLVPASFAPSFAPSPSVPGESAGPSPSISASSGPSSSPGPGGSPAGSADPGAAFHIGTPAPALVVPQLGGGTIDLASLHGFAANLQKILPGVKVTP